MAPVGESLRRERLRQDKTLEEMSEATRIPAHLLRAIEADRAEDLPGPFFARSYTRQYARALRVDEDAIAANLEVPDLFGPAPKAPWKPQPKRLWKPSIQREHYRKQSLVGAFSWVLLAIAGCSLVYFAMTRRQIQPAAPPNAKPPAQALKTPAPTIQPAIASAPPENVAPELTQSSSGAIQVTLTANKDSWVSITVDDHPAFSGTLHPNETKQLAASSKLKVVAGNAGGIDVVLNGKPLGPLGPEGQVRVVELRADGVHVIPRTPPNPDPR